MLNRLIHLSVASLFALPLLACSTGSDDGGSTFGTSFSTTLPTTTSATTTASTTDMMETSSTGGDGDGDPTSGDGDGDMTTTTTTTTTGDGDGDPSTTDDTSCPPGEFNCPCDGGTCVVGLECVDGICQLPPGDGDGDPTTTTTTTTTGGGNDPYDPADCVMPSQIVNITDFEGEVCSPPCANNDADCPAGPVGTQALCLLTIDDMDPSNCVLVCTQGNDTCPAGSTCKPIPMDQLNGLCTYP